MTIVAFNAIVTMHNAAWGDEAGSTVTFRLPTQEDSRNPFHAFTKRRKGAAGTRFHMVVQSVEHNDMLYNDEVMLAGWNDSQQHGHTVKFWLCADQMGHPFEGVSRKEDLGLALTELDDDQQPIDQKMRDRVENQRKRPSERVSYAAAMLCKNPEFWSWCTNNLEIPAHDEETARRAMLNKLGLGSRSQLDENHYQAERFHALIRKPFVESQKAPTHGVN